MLMDDSLKSDDRRQPIRDLLDKALNASGDGQKISIGDLLKAFSNRSFGPLLTLFGLIALLPPLGGIPLVPTTMGTLIFLTSVQLLFGAAHPWVPKWLRQRSVSRQSVETARDKASGVTQKVDKLIGERWYWAANGLSKKLGAVCCILLALLMPPLELLPFAVAAPASVVVLFGLAIVARDGVLMVSGFAASAMVFFFLLPAGMKTLIGFFS